MGLESLSENWLPYDFSGASLTHLVNDGVVLVT
jgi:hypothetical protein